MTTVRFCLKHYLLRLALYILLILIGFKIHAKTSNLTAKTNHLPLEAMWLSVILNKQAAGVTLFLSSKAGLFARKEDLTLWRINLPQDHQFTYQGEAFYQLDTIPELSYQIDIAAQTIDLRVAPKWFKSSIFRKQKRQFAKPTPPSAGGFLNYDLYSSRSSQLTNLNGLFECNGFTRYGNSSSSFLMQNTGSVNQFTRLDTTFTQDRPDKMLSFKVGDTLTRAGYWGGPIRLAGIQLARNFSTQPAFVTFPVPSFQGEAGVPSTVDLFVQNALRLRQDVPAGPFEIQDLPIITGQGQAQFVIKDMLGREEVITRPYYVSPQLLQAGLHDYSYEAGLMRHFYGLASNNYKEPIATATHRLGLNDHLTGEVRAEVARNQQTIGLGGAWLKSNLGIFNAAIANSYGNLGLGQLLSLGFYRQHPLFNLGVNTQFATRRFTQLGLDTNTFGAQQISQLFLGFATKTYGSCGLSYSLRQFYETDRLRLASISYNLPIKGVAFLSIAALRFLGKSPNTLFNISIVLPSFAKGNTASFNTNTQTGQFSLQKNPPFGAGWGYRLLGGVNQRSANLMAQNNYGTYDLGFSQVQQQLSTQANARGGIILLNGKTHLSRRLEDSFAVVKVADYPNIPIYVQNQFLTKTGKDGQALVPNLLSYQKNVIRIHPADLPLNAQVNGETVVAIPYRRTGLFLPFPIKRSQSATLTVLLENKKPLPLDATVNLGKQKDAIPVGLHGKIYLADVTEQILHINWREQHCSITLASINTDKPLPHLGVYICKGIKT